MMKEIFTKNSEDIHHITGYPCSAPTDEVFSKSIQMGSNEDGVIKSVSSPSELHVEQHSVKQIKKRERHICRTDKTPCKLRCPKCIRAKYRSKIFKSPGNLWHHLYQVHNSDRSKYPSISLVVEVLDEISLALKNNESLSTVTRAVKWKMYVDENYD